MIYNAYKVIKYIVNSVLANRDIEINSFDWDDCNIQVTFKNNVFHLHGYNEGYANGANPKIKTNSFNKIEENHHYFMFLIYLMIAKSLSLIYT